ncbi:tyrosine-protein phosphatase [Leucobacter muris]|uniref:Tyrosine-protein phosphatase n=1 Tax=Leucobacter muris TaxID=1935379 RepID=A0ABX5QGD0_9MICO|nr:tyrosine-protein phosphatase [Leucobacter muris]QAB18141.1 tyrosine-protein phosphatase [Leucobacter muris]
MTTTILTRELVLSAPVNLRDLGGIPVSGGVLRSGVAIRTDDLALVTDDVAASLERDGLTAIVDLRSPAEVGITGRGPFGSRAVSYHHLPLMADIGRDMRRQHSLTHEAMGESYVSMFESCGSQLVTALNVIAYTPGATAFHCAAGRDRTGVLAAALLLALGAHDDDIVTDYAKTGANMPAIVDRISCVMGPMLAQLGFDESPLRMGGLAEGDMSVSMRRLLGHLRGSYDEPLEPLRRAGLSDDTVARLRARAVDARAGAGAAAPTGANAA